MSNKINVLVVEDSPVMQMLLVQILNSDPALAVCGTAGSGEQAVDFLKENKPDVIVMDIHMNGMDGFETTRKIMETQPTPIVICTGSANATEVMTTFRALEAGALAAVAKPTGPGHPDYQDLTDKLLQTVKSMAEVKVVKRWPKRRQNDAVPVVSPNERPRAIKAVVIGASTGGPQVLQTILGGLPRDFSIPVLIVQHIAAGFLQGLIDWLNLTCGLQVHVATHGELLMPGQAYMAPDGYHMGVSATGRIVLSSHPAESGLRPAVGYLFRTAAEAWEGQAVAILLTGMGKDGADELKQLKDLGALTIAQDRESSVIHGMPGEAIKLGGARYVLSPEKIVQLLAGLSRNGVPSL
jgi:two-component system chemotaxis response regulator CheB